VTNVKPAPSRALREVNLVELPLRRPPRRERNADVTKKELLNAAEVEFAAKGFDGARLQSIARAVGVQQALIHHYFGDKDGLYRAVIERGMAAVTAGSWSILEKMAADSAGLTSRDKLDVKALVTSFVDLLVDFYAAHTALLAILRHDAEKPAAPPSYASSLSDLQPLLATHFRPVLDAVTVVVEELQRAGTLRADVDPRHLCVSTMAMACLPFQETQMFAVLWPEADFRAPEMIAERKREIVETVLGRILPR
jgi:TetR/AcrR family transcriptional regulator